MRFLDPSTTAALTGTLLASIYILITARRRRR